MRKVTVFELLWEITYEHLFMLLSWIYGTKIVDMNIKIAFKYNWNEGWIVVTDVYKWF
jgi:hypothetical protein